jgi:hypothetical protein
MHENAKARTLAPINIKVALSPLRGKLNFPAMIKNLLDTLDLSSLLETGSIMKC